MSAPRPKQQKITDDQVREIFMSPDISHAEWGRRLSVDQNSIKSIRARKSTRAIKIARELGIIPTPMPRAVVADFSSQWAAALDGVEVRQRRTKTETL